MFKLKQDCPSEDIKKAEEMARALKDKVAQIKDMKVGINSEKAPESNYTIVLEVDFENIDDLNSYQVNPHHLEFGKLINELKTDRACIDYEY
jgi:hypothetical protein